MPDRSDSPSSIPPASELVPPLGHTHDSSDEQTGDAPPSKIDPVTLLAPKQKPDELGRLGAYRVLKVLGKGGMGFVFLAEDEMLERKVALKVMRPDVAVKANAKERFLREGRAAAKVKHDNVITIHAVGDERGVPFLALEYLEGMPLDQYLKHKGEIALNQAIRIARETAQGLQAAHKQGLIHRDIKPANIWLEAPNGRVKVLDFGLARQQKEDTHLTQSGAVVGTPAYMSPEQARGVEIDARSDLWSVGVMLYRLCTGRMPFAGETTLGVLTALALDEPPAPTQLNQKIPLALEKIIARLLRKKPEERFQSAEELIAALSALEHPAATAGVQQVVYMPMAVQPTGNPFAGIEGSDYTDPVSNNAESSVPSATARVQASRAPLRQASASRLTANRTYLTLGVIAALLALTIGGYFTFRGGNKNEPNPKTAIKDKEPAPSIVEVNPKPEIRLPTWPGSLDIGQGGIKMGPNGLPRLTTPFTPEQARQVQEAWANRLGKKMVETIDLGDGVSLDVVLIPPGKFLMGSPSNEKDRLDDEDLHPVEIKHPFYLGKYEVTQKQFQKVMGSNPSEFSSIGRSKDRIGVADTSSYPVEFVTWREAMKFGNAVAPLLIEFGKVRGGLPSEAQWEWAFRAGTTGKFHFGEREEMLARYDNISDAARKRAEPQVQNSRPWDDGYPFTAPVGKFKPNAFGLYDMSGNVGEWCEDFYGPYKTAPQDGTAQANAQSSDERVRRGGSWGSSDVSRSAGRSSYSPIRRSGNIGFRLSIDITEVPIVIPPKKDPPIIKGNEVSFDLGNNIKLEVVKINAKGKTFLMGSPKDEDGRNVGIAWLGDKEEQHGVTFSHDYYMGKYEVTQEQYEAVMGMNPSKYNGAKNPVEKVSWYDAQEFIKKLNEKFKDRALKFRLPSEAEWEYACRAGTTTAYFFGKSLTTAQANFNGSSSKPVGAYEANAFGLYDMHGNVNEWCEDYFGHYGKAPTNGKAQLEKQSSSFRVLRSGDWFHPVGFCRSAFRNAISPDTRTNSDLGFRVAVDIADDSPLLPKKDPPPVTKGPEVSFDLGNGVKLEVVKINAKGKKFLMGSPRDEEGRDTGIANLDKEEAHEVTFGHDYYIGKYEVTQEQHKAVTGKSPAQLIGAKRPVEHLSWTDAQEFNKKLNELFRDRKIRFRLPSEAEWEYACRAGTTTAYHFGKTLAKEQANSWSKAGSTKAVGSYAPNAFGLFDMHGNVWEWCEDFYGSYDAAPKDGRAQSKNQLSGERSRRGGGWDSPKLCRSAIRQGSPPDFRNYNNGFRVAVDIADDSPMLQPK